MRVCGWYHFRKSFCLSRPVFPSGLFQVVFVMAVVDPHLAVINFKNAVNEAAQKVAVVADQDDGAGKVLQRGKQRFT